MSCSRYTCTLWNWMQPKAKPRKTSAGCFLNLSPWYNFGTKMGKIWLSLRKYGFTFSGTKKAESLYFLRFSAILMGIRGNGTNRVRICRKTSHKSSIYGIFSCFGTIFGTISKILFNYTYFCPQEKARLPGSDMSMLSSFR